MLKRDGRVSNTALAFWLVLSEVIALTVLTWYYAVALNQPETLTALAGIIGLINAPVAAVGTLYQLSRWQDRKDKQ